MTSTTGPGETLRAVRRTNNWTLADIAERAEIPLSTLSKIEKGQISPTYEQLVRLSASLKIDIAELFTRRSLEIAAAAAPSGRRSINRLNSGEIIETASRVQCYLSTDLLSKHFTPIISEAKARTLEEFGEFMHHPGEEFVYVVEGQLELHTDCYAPVVLQAGESIYFDSTMGHAYVARGKTRCRFLSICTVMPESERGEAVARELIRKPKAAPSQDAHAVKDVARTSAAKRARRIAS